MNQNTIWFETNDHGLILFKPRNLNFSTQLKALENLSIEDDGPKKEADTDKLFYFTKKKAEMKGQIVYTPEKYGTIQKINQDTQTITVKVKSGIKDFPKNQIMYEIPLDLLMIESNVFRNERVLISANSQAKDIVEKIEEMLGSSKTINYTIFYKGKMFEKGPETCEMLSIIPESRFAVCFSMGKIKSVNRFKSVSNGWGYGNSVDAICCSASRAVRIIGFGIYISENNELECVGKLFRGVAQTKEEYICSKSFTIKNTDAVFHPKIFQLLFDKPIDLPLGEKMSCILEIKSHTSNYGNGGIETSNGEDDTVFTFSQCKCSTNGTSVSSGQIPEIYYIQTILKIFNNSNGFKI